MAASDNGRPLLSVRDLHTYFFTKTGIVRAVSGVSFDVHPGEVVGIVGESGCGKTVTALSILDLVDPPGRVVRGTIEFGGRNLRTLGRQQLRRIRGREIAMVFQNPIAALNPVLSVGRQLSEPYARTREWAASLRARRPWSCSNASGFLSRNGA